MTTNKARPDDHSVTRRPDGYAVTQHTLHVDRRFAAFKRRRTAHDRVIDKIDYKTDFNRYNKVTCWLTETTP